MDNLKRTTKGNIMSNYQETLKDRRSSTNIITNSYTVFYEGFYIHGATYNGTHICYTATILNGGFEFYSKSIEQVKAKIRAYKKAFNL